MSKKVEAAESTAKKEIGASPIKVRATNPGLYGKYREPGEEFVISGEKYPADYADKAKAGKVKAFSDRWMELVDKSDKGDVEEQ